MKNRLPRVLSAYLLLSSITGCTTLFDTEILPADAEDVRDVTDTGTTEGVTEIVETTETDSEVADANVCGGTANLLLDGEPAALGSRCGCGGEVVCNGINRLRCADELPTNLCGGCGILDGAPGESCGRCDDGVAFCSGGQLECSGASSGNLCGGCATLDQALRAPCADDGVSGRYRCDGTELIVCETNLNINECGGAGPLQIDGDDVFAGAPCASGCGAGIVICDGLGGAFCDGPAVNACGECGILLGNLGEPCGCEGTGAWVCDPNGVNVVCRDNAINVCGGCGGLSPVGDLPGDPCPAGGFRSCDTDLTTRCNTGLIAEINSCGGVARLSDQPGDPCGACDSGVIGCVGADSVTCKADRGADAINSCGGCTTLSAPAGSLCGVCGSGIWECDGIDALTCAGDLGAAALNACGGCESLEFAPEENCGECATWQCSGTSLLCLGNPALPGCSELETDCADLNCAALFRQCDERAVGENAVCSVCSEGYREEGELCVEAECSANEDCPPLYASFGACDWATVCAESANQSRNVIPRTCGDGFCVQGEPFMETVACTPRDTDGDDCAGGSCGGGVCVPDPVAPSAPSALSASDGLSSDTVNVRFVGSPTAASYKLLRDGVEIAQPSTYCAGSATDLCYADTGAPAPGVPAAPTGAAASTGRASDIRITWSPATVAAGAPATYTAIAVGESGLQSAASPEDTGYRSALPVLRYEVDVAGSWIDVALNSRYDDTSAPAGSLSGGVVVVTPSTSGNLLSVSGVTAGVGANRTYRVRAVSAAGTGAASADATGRRAAGTVSTYVWSRSQTASGFAPVPAAAAAQNASDANSDAQCGFASWNYSVSVGSTAGGSLELSSTGGPYCFVTALEAPILIAPVENERVSAAPMLQWADTVGATEYRLFVSPSAAEIAALDPTETACASCVINEVVGESEYVVPVDVLSGGTNYYWKARASNDYAPSQDSETRGFLTFIDAYESCSAEGAAPECVTGYCGNGRCTTPNFQYIPAGSDVLGAPLTENQTFFDEQPQHPVSVSAFELMRHEVTQQEWFNVAGANPAYFQTTSCTNGNCSSSENANPNAPVESVPFAAVAAYANALSRAAGLTPCYELLPFDCADEIADWNLGATGCTSMRFLGLSCDGYRLPTEAEWEYAARAGTDGGTYSSVNGGELVGDANDCGVAQPALDAIAWTCINAGGKSHEVEAKLPNVWGLYDMLGNVREWTSDAGRDYRFSSTANPIGPDWSDSRITRGGNWLQQAYVARSADRDNSATFVGERTLGFRLARSVPPYPIPAYGACAEVGFTTACATGYCGNGRCTSPNFQYIPAGSDVLGARPGDDWAEPTDRPQHTVTLSAFEMMRYEVTQYEWFGISGRNPSYFQSPDCTIFKCASNENNNPSAPAERLDFYSVVAYANTLSRQAGLSECYTISPPDCADSTDDWAGGDTSTCTDVAFAGVECNGFRLPTEAEWEYAARAGTDTDTYAGNLNFSVGGCDEQAALVDIAWSCDNSGERTHAVGELIPNAWGLHDMAGNVSEWIGDRWGNYDAASSVNPLGAETGVDRVLRGGSWYLNSSTHRSAARFPRTPEINYDSYVGFRLVRSVR